MALCSCYILLFIEWLKERGRSVLVPCCVLSLSPVAQLQKSLKMDGWGLINWTGMTQGGLNWDLIHST